MNTPPSNDEEICRRVAYIIGEHSGAAKALAEMEERRASGQDVTIFNALGVWLVGPPLSTTRQDRTHGTEEKYG